MIDGPDDAPVPDAAPRGGTAHARGPENRRPRRLAVVSAAIASAAMLGIFLAYLAKAAAADASPVPWLAGFVRALVAIGARLHHSVTQHGWPAAAALAGAAAAAFAVRRTSRPTRQRDLAEIGFCLLVGLAMLLLAAQRVGLATVAASLAAAALLVRHRANAGADTAAPARSGLPVLLLVPVVLGLALRLVDLAVWPPGYAEHAAVHHAELSIPLYDGLRAGFLHGDRVALGRVWNTVVTDQHGPNSLVEALGFCVFGVGMTATRVTSAVLGTLTILLAYGVGSRLAGRRAGLAFALLLALAPWHVSISRYEDTEHVLSPLHGLATLFFLLGTLRRGGWPSFVGLGVSLGLSWYLYSPNQTLPLIVGAVLAAALLGDRSLFAGRAIRALVAGACFVTVSLPALADFVHRGRTLPVRSAYEDDANSRFLSPARLSRQTVGELRELFIAADDPWFSTPGGGLGLLSAALLIPGLLIGAAGLTRRETRPAATLFVVGLPVAFLPAVLAPDVSFRRLILFALLALALCALVLDRALGWFLDAIRSRTLALGGLAVLVAGGAAVSAHAYFGLAHAYETESHRYQRGVATFVRAQLGKSYATIVAAHDWDVDDVRRYLTLAAYGTISGGGWKDGTNARLCQVVKPGDLERSLRNAPTIHGQGVVLADTSLVGAPFEGVDVQAVVAETLPGGRAEVWRDRDGTEVFTFWRYGAGPGGARD